VYPYSCSMYVSYVWMNVCMYTHTHTMIYEVFTWGKNTKRSITHYSHVLWNICDNQALITMYYNTRTHTLTIHTHLHRYINMHMGAHTHTHTPDVGEYFPAMQSVHTDWEEAPEVRAWGGHPCQQGESTRIQYPISARSKPHQTNATLCIHVVWMYCTYEWMYACIHTHTHNDLWSLYLRKKYKTVHYSLLSIQNGPKIQNGPLLITLTRFTYICI
jgi:hypothetical protein